MSFPPYLRLVPLLLYLSYCISIQGVATRLDWLKEISISLLSSVDSLADLPAYKQIVSDIVANLKLSEKRHSYTGSCRTDYKMLLSVLSSSF